MRNAIQWNYLNAYETISRSDEHLVCCCQNIFGKETVENVEDEIKENGHLGDCHD